MKIKFTIILAIVSFLGFLVFTFAVGSARHAAEYKKSVEFCESKGFTDYKVCSEWWNLEGDPTR